MEKCISIDRSIIGLVWFGHGSLLLPTLAFLCVLYALLPALAALDRSKLLSGLFIQIADKEQVVGSRQENEAVGVWG